VGPRGEGGQKEGWVQGNGLEAKVMGWRRQNSMNWIWDLGRWGLGDAAENGKCTTEGNSPWAWKPVLE
jgi:hypothetical protein